MKEISDLAKEARVKEENKRLKKASKIYKKCQEDLLKIGCIAVAKINYTDEGIFSDVKLQALLDEEIENIKEKIKKQKNETTK